MARKPAADADGCTLLMHHIHQAQQAVAHGNPMVEQDNKRIEERTNLLVGFVRNELGPCGVTEKVMEQFTSARLVLLEKLHDVARQSSGVAMVSELEPHLRKKLADARAGYMMGVTGLFFNIGECMCSDSSVEKRA